MNTGYGRNKWNFIVGSRRGSWHRQNNMKNQDNCFYKRMGDRYIMVLCDGTGKTDINCTAVKEIAEVIAEFLSVNCDELKTASNEDISYSLFLQINHVMYRYAKKTGKDKREFTSTIMACMVDESDSSLLVLHLGDGVILKKVKNGIGIISYPENGEQSNQTYLTCSKGATEKLRIYKNKLDRNIKYLAMLTDGNYNLPISIDKLSASIQSLKSKSELSEGNDDKSIIIMRRESDDE